MSLKVRQPWDSGASLGFSVQRMADDLIYDPSDATFKASPANPVMLLVEGTGNYAGRYSATIVSTPMTQWGTIDFAVWIHDRARAGSPTVEVIAVVMHDTGTGQADDSTILPAGAGAAPPSVQQIAAAILVTPANRLATTAAGAVVLAADGLDLVIVEPSVNARQALALIGAERVGGWSYPDPTNTGHVRYTAMGGTMVRVDTTFTSAGRQTTLTPPA